MFNHGDSEKFVRGGLEEGEGDASLKSERLPGLFKYGLKLCNCQPGSTEWTVVD
jgi:hypothetical protein